MEWWWIGRLVQDWRWISRMVLDLHRIGRLVLYLNCVWSGRLYEWNRPPLRLVVGPYSWLVPRLLAALVFRLTKDCHHMCQCVPIHCQLVAIQFWWMCGGGEDWQIGSWLVDWGSIGGLVNDGWVGNGCRWGRVEYHILRCIGGELVTDWHWIDIGLADLQSIGEVVMDPELGRYYTLHLYWRLIDGLAQDLHCIGKLV